MLTYATLVRWFIVEFQITAEETMEREKNTFVRGLTRLIFCIIVTLLFGRSMAFCQVGDEFDDLPYETNRSFARAEPGEGLALGMLDQQQVLPPPLAHLEPEAIRSVPVPPAPVTAGVFVAAMVVGWLRRRTPSELPK